MLNEAMDEVVLVKGWKKNANWSFPRGKINKDEKDLHCAIREVYEETGFDIHTASLVTNEEDVKYIEVTMREQHMRLYIFRGVPMDTIFEPRTRKEISKIQWYKLSELPTLKKMRQQQQEGRGEDLAVNAKKFYMVAPFLVPLKKWISQQKKLDAMNSPPPDGNALRQSDIDAQLDQPVQSSFIVDLPQTNDMSRLMTQLRQSGQMTNATTDVAELSGPESAKDASTQLKSLLHVPPHTTQPSNLDKDADTRQEKAQAMLSLLRSGANAQPTQFDQCPQPPQTPFEQILWAPQLPPSPKHHSSHPPHATNLPPPNFPYSPNQVGRKSSNQSTYHTGQKAPVSGSMPYPAFQQSAKNVSQPGQFLPYSMPQRSNRALAPYQRTGDPQFADGLRHSQDLPSSIPPAHALPPPKLTTHSSALLDIFKTGTLSKPSDIPFPSQTPLMSEVTPAHLSQSAGTSQSTEAPRIFSQRGSVIPKQDAAPTTAAPGLATAQTTAAPRPRSGQQETLLNLFRTPSTPAISKSHTSSPSLAPPTTLVELSAQPSPSHSRVSSDTKKETTKPQLTNGNVTIQKRPEAPPKPGQAPVSATVTGPLHFPHFDKILKRPTENTRKATNGSLATHGNKEPKPQFQPITILSRPLTESKPPSDLQPIQSRPVTEEKGKTSGPWPTLESILPMELLQEQVRLPYHPSSAAIVEREPSKLFQPQILQRPARSQPGLGSMSSTSVHAGPSSSAQTKEADYPLDHRTSQTQEQKNALLSLFSKSQSVLAPPTPTFNSLASQLSERSARVESALPSPMDPSRARFGSLVDDDIASGGGTKGGSSGRQTPKISPVDKQFLLGFLADVVKGVK